ncbi:MAG: nitrogen regulation protein NR(I) [Parvibaculales bacterium]
MSQGTVLVADDDKAIRTVLTQALTRAGFEVRAAGTASSLWQWVSNGEGDVIVTDVMMPDQNAFDLIPRIKKLRPDLPIIVISAKNTLGTAITAAEKGAFDYLPKPFDLAELTDLVQRAIEVPRDTGNQRDEADDEDGLPLVGGSPAMQEIYRAVARLTQNDLSVLITGESGTGKELVARALHDYGTRKRGEFVAINMAAIPRDLIESELFGHEKGAFTGANQRMDGRFAQAEGGTLFLDEIGDMPMETQTRLLRVLQEGEYTTIGGRTPIKTDVRIIAATHQDLRRLIRQGLFREDLYFRLNVVPLRLPPLRERLEDIDDLVRHFMARGVEEGLAAKNFDQAARDEMRAHSWPGNVRELENLVRRLCALYVEDTISADAVRMELNETDLQAPGVAPAEAGSLTDSLHFHLNNYFKSHGNGLPPNGLYERVLREVELPLIELSLEATRGNQIKAAELLGLNRNTLRKKIQELNIEVVRGGKK